MDPQKRLQFENGQAMATLALSVGIDERAVALLRLIFARGSTVQVGGLECSRLAISKRKLGVALTCSANAATRAAVRLAGMGLLESLTEDRQTVYLVCWDRLNRLAPPADQPYENLDLFSDNSQPPPDGKVVRAGPRWSGVVRAPVSCNTHVSKPRVTVSRAPCHELADHPAPWSALTDAQLRQAIHSGDRAVLFRLFSESVETGHLGTTEGDKRDFLACAHHAATAKGINHPVAVLISAIKKGNFSRVPNRSEDWAAEFIRAGRQAANRAALDRIESEVAG